MRAPAIPVLWMLLAASAAQARDLRVQVVNQRGEPVVGAVVYVATPLTADASTTGAASAPVIIDQINKEFVPHVSAVQAGTAVRFPNHDNIRHHVYSFSPAKTFELPLYKDAAPAPVLFDKPGVVSLGCNIHDWMTSYVFVAAHRFFVVTGKDGAGVLRDLPEQVLDVEAWHPRQKEDAKTTRQSSPANNEPLLFKLEEKAALRPFRGQASGKNGY